MEIGNLVYNSLLKVYEGKVAPIIIVPVGWRGVLVVLLWEA